MKLNGTQGNAGILTSSFSAEEDLKFALSFDRMRRGLVGVFSSFSPPSDDSLASFSPKLDFDLFTLIRVFNHLPEAPIVVALLSHQGASWRHLTPDSRQAPRARVSICQREIRQISPASEIIRMHDIHYSSHSAHIRPKSGHHMLPSPWSLEDFLASAQRLDQTEPRILLRRIVKSIRNRENLTIWLRCSTISVNFWKEEFYFRGVANLSSTWKGGHLAIHSFGFEPTKRGNQRLLRKRRRPGHNPRDSRMLQIPRRLVWLQSSKPAREAKGSWRTNLKLEVLPEILKLG